MVEVIPGIGGTERRTDTGYARVPRAAGSTLGRGTADSKFPGSTRGRAGTRMPVSGRTERGTALGLKRKVTGCIGASGRTD